LFTQQGTTIAATLTQYYTNFRQAVLGYPSILLHRLAERLPASLTVTPPGPVPANPQEPLDRAAVVLSYGRMALHALFTTLVTLLLTYYWTIDRDRIVRSSLIFVPAARRESVREFIEASENKVGAYLRGLAIMCSTIGVLSMIAYLFIGLPYAPLLAVMAGLMEAVPLIGPILGAIPAVLIALALDPSRVIWVIASTIIIQQFENHILVPRVMNQAVGVNPVISLLAFVIFSSLFGLPGALLAVPLAATIQLIFNRTLFVSPEQVPAGRDSLSVLRYEAQELIQDVRKQVREKETTIDDPSDQVEDAIEAIVNDLDSILAKEEKTTIEETAAVQGGQA
jgi:predicted PurR-regulated permease PerM